MYNKNISDLHTENYSSKEALKSIRKIEHKKEYTTSLSRQFQISHLKTNKGHLIGFLGFFTLTIKLSQAVLTA